MSDKHTFYLEAIVWLLVLLLLVQPGARGLLTAALPGLVLYLVLAVGFVALVVVPVALFISLLACGEWMRRAAQPDWVWDLVAVGLAVAPIIALAVAANL